MLVPNKSVMCYELMMVTGIKSMDIDSEKNVLTVVGNMDAMKIVAALRKAKYAAELVSATNTDGGEGKDVAGPSRARSAKLRD